MGLLGLCGVGGGVAVDGCKGDGGGVSVMA